MPGFRARLDSHTGCDFNNPSQFELFTNLFTNTFLYISLIRCHVSVHKRRVWLNVCSFLTSVVARRWFSTKRASNLSWKLVCSDFECQCFVLSACQATAASPKQLKQEGMHVQTSKICKEKSAAAVKMHNIMVRTWRTDCTFKGRSSLEQAM